MEISLIIQELSLEDTKFYMSTSDGIKTPFDISPQEFLKYAEVDLASDYQHNIVNALSNSKRALDCQLDTLLYVMGFYTKSQDKFWNFPKKLELIKELGIIAPRVLHKINKQRNLLEHQFVKPSKEVVEDFLDITMLFIASTDRYTLKFIQSLNFQNVSLYKEYHIKNDYKNETLNLKVYSFKSEEVEGKPKFDRIEIADHNLKLSDDGHSEILKLYLKHFK